MKKRPHVPIRTCLGCGRRERQAEMLRIVWDSRAGLSVDARREHGGRGGYLHGVDECWVRFARRKGMVRSLGAAVDRAARAELVDRLRARIGQ